MTDARREMERRSLATAIDSGTAWMDRALTAERRCFDLEETLRGVRREVVAYQWVSAVRRIDAALGGGIGTTGARSASAAESMVAPELRQMADDAALCDNGCGRKYEFGVGSPARWLCDPCADEFYGIATVESLSARLAAVQKSEDVLTTQVELLREARDDYRTRLDAATGALQEVRSTYHADTCQAFVASDDFPCNCHIAIARRALAGQEASDA